MARGRAGMRLSFLALILVVLVLLQVIPSSFVYTTTPSRANVSYLPGVQHQRRGYAITFVYAGQQGAGMNALMSQLRWIGSYGLPMYVVEPFVEHSNVRGFPKHSTDITSGIRVGDLFDIDHINAISRQEGYALLSNLEDFVENASRIVVLLVINEVNWQVDVRPPHVEWAASENESCHSNDVVNKQVVQEALQILDGNFCVIRVVSAYTTDHVVQHKVTTGNTFTAIFNLEELDNCLFGGRKPEDVTLLINRWTWHWSLPYTSLDSHVLSPSKQLLETAMHYEKVFLKGRHHVSAMIRAERLMIRFYGPKLEEEVGNCFKKVVNIVQYIMDQKHLNQSFVMADIGKYGSHTWKLSLRNKVNSIDSFTKVSGMANSTLNLILQKGTLTFKQWENSFANVTNGIEESGYIAALQRTIASRADCLVLAGGGNFVKLALQDYINNHPDPSTRCVHFACIEEQFEQEYQILLKSEVKAGIFR